MKPTFNNVLLSKSCGYERVAMAAGVRWYWDPLVTDQHTNGEGKMVAFQRGKDSVWCHLVDGSEQLCLGMALLPWRKDLEKTKLV